MINFRGNMESLAYKERTHDHYFVRENKSVIIRLGNECAKSEMKECTETYFDVKAIFKPDQELVAAVKKRQPSFGTRHHPYL